MSPQTEGFCVGFLSGISVLACLTYLFPMTDPAIREAIKHGKAEYYLDANHERQWRWKPEPVTNLEK